MVGVLKQMAPWIKRAGVLRNSANPAGIAQFGAIRAMASSLGVDVSPINVREAARLKALSRRLRNLRMAA